MPIPKEWRDAVRKILHRRCKNDIMMTARASNEWQMTFPDAFHGELYDAIELAMADSRLMGRLVPDSTPLGKTYAFMFFFRATQLYGKVNLLLPDKKIVFIISAHPPNKGNIL